MGEVRKFAKPNVIILLVGNKKDLEENWVVSTEEGKKMAEFYGIDFFETSAKETINIDECFKSISRKVILDLKKEV